MFRKISASTLKGGVFSVTALAILAGASAARAEPAASGGKAWVDPGAIERSKTQGASPGQPIAPSAAPVGVAKEPGVKEKIDTAAEKEKLKEIIQKSEKSGEKPAPQAAQAPEKKPDAVLTDSAGANAGPAQKQGPRVTHATRKSAKHIVRSRPTRHYAYDSLPNKKDGAAPAPVTPQYDPFTGYAQPIRAAY